MGAYVFLAVLVAACLGWSLALTALIEWRHAATDLKWEKERHRETEAELFNLQRTLGIYVEEETYD